MGVVQKLCDWEEKERGGESGEGAQRRKENNTPDNHARNYDGEKVTDNFKNRTVLFPHTAFQFSAYNRKPHLVGTNSGLVTII